MHWRIFALFWCAPRIRATLVQVARAMANMGLRELVITSPRFPDMCEQPEAIALASGATDVLAQAQIVPDLATALQG